MWLRHEAEHLFDAEAVLVDRERLFLGAPTDLVLEYYDVEDDIFHMVEVTRTTGDRRGFRGMPQ